MSRNVSRAMCAPVVGLALLVGCMQPHPMEMPKKPTPSPEMQKLSRLVGNWTSTWEMVKPTAEEMKKMMPDMPSTGKGGGKWEMGLGGMSLNGTMWNEMGKDKMNFEENWLWDDHAKVYRTFWRSDWNEMGAGTAKWCGDNCLCVEAKYYSPMHGGDVRGEGCMKFVDNDTLEFCWAEKGMLGMTMMEMKGTSKRAK